MWHWCFAFLLALLGIGFDKEPKSPPLDSSVSQRSPILSSPARKASSPSEPVVPPPFLHRNQSSPVPQYVSSGSLHVRAGPMFCGKTTWLKEQLSCNAELSSACPLLINHGIDSREKGVGPSSHVAYFGMSPRIQRTKIHWLADVDVSKAVVIGVDEAQLFEDLVPTVAGWLKEGKQVYVAGLDGYASGEPFGHISGLLHLAESFVKMTAICVDCRKEMISLPTSSVPRAAFTGKIRGVQAGKQEVDIGGADKYVAACRFHHSQYLLPE